MVNSKPLAIVETANLPGFGELKGCLQNSNREFCSRDSEQIAWLW